MKKLSLLVLLLLFLSSPAHATFTYVQSAGALDDANGTSLGVQLTSVTAGALIVCYPKWEAGDTTVTMSDGTSSLTAGTKENHTNADLHSQFFYLLVANGGTKTYTATWAATRGFRRVHCWEATYANTIVLDQQSTNESSSTTAVTSGNITTTGTEEAVFGGYGEYSSASRSAIQVFGVAADQSLTSVEGTFTTTWYRRLTATGTGAATLTLDGGIVWVANVISFKEVSAASPVRPRRPLFF